jgi:hypothetical protein
VKPADFSKKEKEYLKKKINKHPTTSKDKNIRDLYIGINEFQEGLPTQE